MGCADKTLLEKPYFIQRVLAKILFTMKSFRTHVGLILYGAGGIIGLVIVVLSTWADLEAQFYGFDRRASAVLTGVSCPVWMTPTEQAQVTLRLSNPTDRRLSPVVRTAISTPLLPEVSLRRVDLEPGESATLTWTIGPQHIDLKRFIFVDVLVYAAYPLLDRQTMCGVLILPLPIPGRWLTPLTLLASLAGMGVGVWMLWRQRVTWLAWRTMPMLALSITVAMAFSLLGVWVWSLVALVVIALLFLITLGLALMGERYPSLGVV